MKYTIKSLFPCAVLVGLIFSFTTINTVSAQSGDVDNSGNNGNSCVTLDNNLRYRMRDVSVNNEVSDLQDYLIAEGYLSGNTTGYFGVATLKAVKSFQSANGLISSGYVGPVTRAKIKSLSCDTANHYDGRDPVPVTNRPVLCTDSLVPYYKYNSNTNSCYYAGTGSNGCYVFKSGEYKTETECKSANGISSNPSGVMCTMEARLCPDGTTMYRDNNCGWHAEGCKQGSQSSSSYIDSVFFENNGSVAVIRGRNLNKADSIEIRDPNNPNSYAWGGIIDLSKASIQPYLTRADNEIKFTQYASEMLGCKIAGDTKMLIPKVQITVAMWGSKSNTQIFTCPTNNDGQQVNNTFLNLLTPIDVERGNPITSINVGGYMNVCWKYGQQKDDVISFGLTSVNANKGDGSYILGSANLSQNCYVISIPSTVPNGHYVISANNQSGTLYSNSPSFNVMSVKPTITAQVTNHTDSDWAEDNMATFYYTINNYKPEYKLRVVPNFVCTACSGLDNYRINLSGVEAEKYTDGRVNTPEKDGIDYIFTGPIGRINFIRNMNDNVGVKLTLQIVKITGNSSMPYEILDSVIITPTVKG